MTHHAGRISCLLRSRAKAMALGILAVLWACETESGRVLAGAAGHELTVDQMVEILARQNTVPNQADVVDALANFWVGFTLIARHLHACRSSSALFKNALSTLRCDA